jgi:NADH-quinone oxidoreductase subunit N
MVVTLLLNTLSITFLSSSYKTITGLTIVFVLSLGRHFLSVTKLYHYEYDLLLLCSIIALGILTYSNDLLAVYLGIELQGLAIYSLIALYNYSELSLESSIKYFILGAITSCFLLFGISLLYFSFGSISLSNLILISKNCSNYNSSSAGIVLIIITILFKLGVAPFHI